MDKFGLLPGGIREAVEREALVDRQEKVARDFQRRLKEYNPDLSLVWVNENAPDVYGWHPGRWHIVIPGKDTADTYRPIITPDGGYREPSEYDLNWLREHDLQNPRSGAWERLDVSGEKEAKREQHNQALKAEQRKDEIAANTRAAFRVAGEGGMTRRRWGKNKLKGILGS